MPKKSILPPEQFVDLHFPLAGIDVSMGFDRQMPRPMENGQYARTTPQGVNVQAYEPSSNRARGGQRPGLKKYVLTPVIADWIIQELALIVTGKTVPQGGIVQQSNSGRVVSVVAVSQGNIFVANPGDTVWTPAINATSPLLTPPLNFTGILFSAANQQKLWFADGVNYVFYDPIVNTVFSWKASAGVLPVDGENNTPRLITTWRGRTVLSGLLKDPQNWFMSAVDDPTNWDYSPLSVTPTQAIAGTVAPQGLLGDVVTALIAYTDDVLVIGGDHTIWMFRGDPLQGGNIDLISDSIGMAWGIPWCKDPYGNIYFLSNRTGIYTLVPGQAPQRISQQIENLLAKIDTGANAIRLFWNDTFQGLQVFISPLAAPGPTTHYFYEKRTGGWFQRQHANMNHDPLTGCVFDGNLPTDRVVLIGSWDGYVRSIDPTAVTDDGVAIQSKVMIGPLLTKDLDDVLLKDIQGILASASGPVKFAVFSGQTAEIALASQPVSTGTWQAGRNFSNFIRRADYAHYIQLSASNAWAMETIRARIAAQGKVRRRAAKI